IFLGGQADGFVGEWATAGGSYAFVQTNSVRAALDADYPNVHTTTLTPVTPGTYSTLNHPAGTDATLAGPTSYQAQALRLHPGEPGRTLNLTGAGNLAVNGLLLTGPNSYTIQNAGGGTGGVAGTGARYIGVDQGMATLTISTRVLSPGNDIVKYGDGVLALT